MESEQGVGGWRGPYDHKNAEFEASIQILKTALYPGCEKTLGEKLVELLDTCERYSMAASFFESLVADIHDGDFPKNHIFPDNAGLRKLLRQLGVSYEVEVACADDHELCNSGEFEKSEFHNIFLFNFIVSDISFIYSQGANIRFQLVRGKEQRRVQNV